MNLIIKLLIIIIQFVNCYFSSHVAIVYLMRSMSVDHLVFQGSHSEVSAGNIKLRSIHIVRSLLVVLCKYDLKLVKGKQYCLLSHYILNERKLKEKHYTFMNSFW